MNMKNILANILKFSAAKAVVFMILIPSVGSLFVIGSFYLYLEQSKDDVLFTNIAGQQRMLSEQLGAYVDMVHHLGQEDDREPLRELVAAFDRSLIALDQGGIVMDHRLSLPSPEVRNSINRVKQLWQDLKPALVLVADQPASSPQAIKAHNFIQVSIPRLRDLSNEVVVRFELLTNNKRTQVFRIIITVLSVNFVLLLIGILVTKRYLADRKLLENELRMEKDYLDKLSNSIGEAIFTVELSERKIIYANDRIKNIFGYDPKKIVGKITKMLYLDEKSYNEFGRKLNNAIEKNEDIMNTELLLKRKNGEHFQAEITTSFLKENGKVQQVISIIRDISNRKQAEEALRTSKAYSENILSSMTDALFVITSDAIIETVNTTVTTLLGYTEDELIGKPLGMVFEENREDTFTKQVMSVSENKLQVIYDHDPKDFWHLLKTVPLGIVIVDSDGKIVMVNEETESIFEYGKGELIGKTIHGLLRGKLRNVHEKERVEYMASPSQRYLGKERFLKAQRKDGTTFELEIGLFPLQIDDETQVVSVIRDTASKEKWEFIKHTRFVRIFTEKDYRNVDRTLVNKNGEKIPVLMSGSEIRDKSGESQGAVLIAKDITERKTAQKEIERLANFPRRNPMPVIEINVDCNVTYMNPATEAILKQLGLSKSQVSNILPENCKQMVKDGLEKGGKVSSREVQFADRVLLWSGHALKELNLFHFYATDITERVKSRKEIEEALNRVEQADRVKSLFLANMSHEIRTPLNAILGFTELIESSTCHLVSEEEQEFFTTIKNSGTRLMNTVHEILDITQIESGTYELKMEQLDLSRLVKELVHACQPTADDKNLELTYESDLDSAYIQADENGLSQAINNIIDNAIKYTEQGKITVLLKQSSKHYVLSIQDTGIGISKEYLDKLFEVFSQESEGYTKKYQGIGLGMSIAKRHLDLNNIDIDIETAKDIGTTFTLSFKPVKKRISEKQVEKEETKVTPTVEPAEKPFVLVVEDDLGSRKLIEFFIKGTHDMCFAVSLKEAKQQLKKYPIDLILLDLSLIGNEDGLDLVRWIRKTKTWKKTPVIATTAHAFTSDRDACLEAGCNDYLSKPIKREILLEKINDSILTNNLKKSG